MAAACLKWSPRERPTAQTLAVELHTIRFQFTKLAQATLQASGPALAAIPGGSALSEAAKPPEAEKEREAQALPVTQIASNSDQNPGGSAPSVAKLIGRSLSQELQSPASSRGASKTWPLCQAPGCQTKSLSRSSLVCWRHMPLRFPPEVQIVGVLAELGLLHSLWPCDLVAAIVACGQLRGSKSWLRCQNLKLFFEACIYVLKEPLAIMAFAKVVLEQGCPTSPEAVANLFVSLPPPY
jgi:hypothetical protein